MKTIRAYLLPGLTLLFSTIIFGCSKKNDPPGVSGKKVKITVALSGTFSKAEGDYFDVSVTGYDNAANFVDWRVDGVKKTGVIVRVGTDDFNGGKTIVLESDGNFTEGHVSIGGFENGNTAYTATYKVEVNGAVKDEGTESLTKGRDPVFAKRISF